MTEDEENQERRRGSDAQMREAQEDFQLRLTVGKTGCTILEIPEARGVTVEFSVKGLPTGPLRFGSYPGPIPWDLDQIVYRMSSRAPGKEDPS